MKKKLNPFLYLDEWIYCITDFSSISFDRLIRKDLGKMETEIMQMSVSYSVSPVISCVQSNALMHNLVNGCLENMFFVSLKSVFSVVNVVPLEEMDGLRGKHCLVYPLCILRPVT